jgi:hypothetical protein
MDIWSAGVMLGDLFKYLSNLNNENDQLSKSKTL